MGNFIYTFLENFAKQYLLRMGCAFSQVFSKISLLAHASSEYFLFDVTLFSITFPHPIPNLIACNLKFNLFVAMFIVILFSILVFDGS